MYNQPMNYKHCRAKDEKANALNLYIARRRNWVYMYEVSTVPKKFKLGGGQSVVVYECYGSLPDTSMKQACTL